MFRHAGLEESAPYSVIRGYLEEVPDVLARLGSLRLPSVARLEFTPMKIGAGMTILTEGVIDKQALTNRASPVHAKGMARDKIRSSARKKNHRPHKVGREAQPAHGDC